MGLVSRFGLIVYFNGTREKMLEGLLSVMSDRNFYGRVVDKQLSRKYGSLMLREVYGRLGKNSIGFYVGSDDFRMQGDDLVGGMVTKSLDKAGIQWVSYPHGFDGQPNLDTLVTIELVEYPKGKEERVEFNRRFNTLNYHKDAISLTKDDRRILYELWPARDYSLVNPALFNRGQESEDPTTKSPQQ